MAILERFQIKGLHGSKNLDLRFVNDTLILVGENGSGKTTVLRILFAFLSGRWLSLAQYKFDSIVATVAGREFALRHEEVVKGFEQAGRTMLDLPPAMQQRVIELVERGGIDNPHELEMLAHRYGIPPEIILRQVDFFQTNPEGPRKELQERIKAIQGIMGAQILYLPTYRRIERELGSIFEGADMDDVRRHRARFRPREKPDDQVFVELVEFGMRDVQAAVDAALERLREFARHNLNNLTLKYLGEVFNRAYDKVDVQGLAGTSEEAIRAILDRIQEPVLSKDQKNHLVEVLKAAGEATGGTDDHRKILYHYFLKLREFQEALQKREKNISAFCSLCSEYITDKKFSYDSSTFQFSIKPLFGPAPRKDIALSDLSSGEKQIVSLFSHLYLSGKKLFFVLIDEPELSLSVPWQRRFLVDIRKGEYCAGLVATTHSPFIYENELRASTHAIGEFQAI